MKSLALKPQVKGAGTYTPPPEPHVLKAACDKVMRDLIREEDEKFIRFVNESAEGNGS